MGKEAKGSTASTASGGAAWRKLKPVIDDLDKIAKEYGAATDEKEMADMDKFLKIQKSLRDQLIKIGKDVDEWKEMQRDLAEGEKSVNSISLQSSIRKQLKSASDTYVDLKSVLDKELKKGDKSKVPKEELARRGESLGLLGQQIVDYNQRIASVKEIKSTVPIGAVSAKRAQKREEKKRRGRKGRRGRAAAEEEDGGDTEGGDDAGGGDPDIDEIERAGAAAPPSAQVQEFMARKEKEEEEQDQIIDLISAGLSDLKRMGESINKELKLQDKIIDDLDVQMDKSIEKVKGANVRLQEIIDAQGGVTRWCPILICMIILLALLGYIYKMTA